ncbi:MULTISPECIES: hypothetical protein [Oxalobacteraceae]|uniref:hypothetical protein n=1 Tax=Oxalobacteraceae TaxID=75682 RepID=UPI0002AE9EE7|nr:MULTISPECIES: hypothetical protein [Oxalobacteraceae]ELX08920.1 hypothetical protein Jab_2c09780 [Janthinobacterium sp. HH01]OEZ63640.1 hypothetical protein DUGA6_01410 [Duganella sp. HH105]OFA03738.1 hypothetical protein DUGA2_27760 [Duganella sp. HH101]
MTQNQKPQDTGKQSGTPGSQQSGTRGGSQQQSVDTSRDTKNKENSDPAQRQSGSRDERGNRDER